MAKRRYAHEAPEPLEGDNVAVTAGGTVIWFVLLLALLPFYGRLDDADRLWWLWTCLTGGLLGLVGVWYIRRREASDARKTAEDMPADPPANA